MKSKFDKFLSIFKNKYIQNSIIILFFICIFVAFLYGVEPHENVGVDYSWFWALNNLILRRDLAPGVDYNFTYGPLGFILVPLNYGHNLYLTIFCSFLCSITIAGLIFANYKNKNIAPENIVNFAILFFIFVIPTADWLWAICVYFLSISILYLKKNPLVLSILSILAGALSVFCLLLKMNLAICSIFTFVILAFIFLIEDRRKFFNYFICYTSSLLCFYIISIKYLFFNMVNFKTWFLNSLEIARGFSYAMSIDGSLPYLLFAFVILGLYIYLSIVSYKKDKDIFKLFVLGFPLLFFVYKHGFTRQDTHMFSFYSTVFYLLGFIYLFSKGELSKKIFKIFLVTTLLSFVFLFTYKEIHPQNSLSVVSYNLKNLITINKNINNNLDERERFYKPLLVKEDWQKEINGSSIEVLPHEIVYVQANNWKNWRPNPILQLYSVYTYKLDKISANSLISANGPDFILLEFKSIDGRNMYLDTPATFSSINSGYEILKSDDEKILLKRRNTFKNTVLKLKSVDKYTFGQKIYLPKGDNIQAKIYIEPSLIGSFLAFIFRVNEVQIDIDYNISNPKSYRIVPDTLKSPVSIAYIPNDINELKSLMQEKPNKRCKVKSIKFNNNGMIYKKSIKIEWFETY